MRVGSLGLKEELERRLEKILRPGMKCEAQTTERADRPLGGCAPRLLLGAATATLRRPKGFI